MFLWEIYLKGNIDFFIFKLMLLAKKYFETLLYKLFKQILQFLFSSKHVSFITNVGYINHN